MSYDQSTYHSADGQREWPSYLMPLQASLKSMKFMAWFWIIFGGLSVMNCIGIIYAWALIWSGVALLQAAKSVELAFDTGDTNALHEGLEKLREHFKYGVISMMIGLGVMALVIVGYIVFFIFIFAGIASGAGSGGGNPYGF